MHLICIDESGNTGNDLKNKEQPVFLLCALLVPDTVWHSLEDALEAALDVLFPNVRASGAEIHGADLRIGRGEFKGVPVAGRIALRDKRLAIATDFEFEGNISGHLEIPLGNVARAGVSLGCPHQPAHCGIRSGIARGGRLPRFSTRTRPGTLHLGRE